MCLVSLGLLDPDNFLYMCSVLYCWLTHSFSPKWIPRSELYSCPRWNWSLAEGDLHSTVWACIFFTFSGRLMSSRNWLESDKQQIGMLPLLIGKLLIIQRKVYRFCFLQFFDSLKQCAPIPFGIGGIWNWL